MPQYQMPRPLPPIGGPSTTPVPIVHTVGHQPALARYAGLHVNRFVVDAPKQLDGAVLHQSYLFAVGQPQSRRQFQIPRAKAPIDVVTAAVTQTDVFRSEQPDAARYAARQALRFLVSAPPRLEGATSQPSYLFQPNQPELVAYGLKQTSRFLVPAPPRFEGATTQPSFVFSPNQPELSRYGRLQALRFTVDAPKRIDDGAAAVVPQTYIFPLAQPELRAWLKFDANRVPAGPTPQTTGPTTQATFIFPVAQPEPRYYVRNTFAETKTPILGVTVVAAQTYEFAVGQPEARRYNLSDVNRLAQPGPEPPLDSTTVPQTYVFAVSQPERRAWPRFDPNDLQTGSPHRTAGATNQQTYVFVPNQPEQRSYALLQRARGLGGSVAWPLNTFAPLVPVPRLIQVLLEAAATPTMSGQVAVTPTVTNEQVTD